MIHKRKLPVLSSFPYLPRWGVAETEWDPFRGSATQTGNKIIRYSGAKWQGNLQKRGSTF